MIVMIIACEIGFWVVLAAGLAARYVFRARRLSTFLLVCVPLVDVVLLAVTAVDLRRGGAATASHGLAAIYIGVSVAFGHQMIDWADRHAARWFATGPAGDDRRRKVRLTGRAHAAHERRQWLRHLLAYVIGVLTLGLLTLVAGGGSSVLPAWQPFTIWTIVVVIDFIVAFSYTLSPRKTSVSRHFTER
jgi:hypothetical protein